MKENEVLLDFWVSVCLHLLCKNLLKREMGFFLAYRKYYLGWGTQGRPTVPYTLFTSCQKWKSPESGPSRHLVKVTKLCPYSSNNFWSAFIKCVTVALSEALISEYTSTLTLWKIWIIMDTAYSSSTYINTHFTLKLRDIKSQKP